MASLSQRKLAFREDQTLFEPAHTTVHTEPRPEPYDKLRYIQVKRVFHTPPEVMGMVIESGRAVLGRMAKHPAKTLLMSLEAGFLLSFGVQMSVSVGGRWGGSIGSSNLAFGVFGIPFGLTFIVFMQGSELMTANYMYTTFAVLAQRGDGAKALIANWILCWIGNFAGAVLHFVLFAWQAGLVTTIKVRGGTDWDSANEIENLHVLYYDSRRAFQDDFFDGDLCSRDDYKYANTCRLLDLAYKKTTADFWTTVLRGWGANWMVCLAMWLQTTATEPISKLFMILLPISLFVATGYDHFVVNMWLIPGGILVGANYLDPRVNFGNALWFNLLPATIGAILGAWCLVFHIWYLYKDYWLIAQEKRRAYSPAPLLGSTTTSSSQQARE